MSHRTYYAEKKFNIENKTGGVL